MTEYQCPQCKQVLRAGEGHGSQALECPTCRQRFVPFEPPLAEEVSPPAASGKVYTLRDLAEKQGHSRRSAPPPADDLSQFPCDHCGKMVVVRLSKIGKRVVCPKCGEQTSVRLGPGTMELDETPAQQ